MRIRKTLLTMTALTTGLLLAATTTAPAQASRDWRKPSHSTTASRDWKAPAANITASRDWKTTAGSGDSRDW
jgi:hypothetical protein